MMIDVLLATLKAFLFLNAAVGVMLIFLARAKRYLSKAPSAVSSDKDTLSVTYVFLGPADRVIDFEPLCNEIIGEVIFVWATHDGYSCSTLIDTAIDDFEKRVYQADQQNLDVRIIGVSLGAQVATCLATHLLDLFQVKAQLYLVNPCLGREHLRSKNKSYAADLFWQSPPIVLMEMILLIALRCAIGIFGTIRLKALNNLSLNMYLSAKQMELGSVQLMPASLLISYCHVVISLWDEKVSIAASKDYFYGCKDVVDIKARHCDFTERFQEYYDALDKCGLYR